MESQVTVSIAGDYAVLETGTLNFYYGYEYVWCIDHAAFADKCSDDCETEWAFAVKRGDEYIFKHRCSSEFDEFSVEQQLIYGLGKYISMGQECGD